MHIPNMKRSITLLVVALATVTLMGCSEPQPEITAAPEAPPPPSPEETAAKIIGELQLNAALPAPGSKMSPEASTSFLSSVRNTNNANRSTPEGERAMRIVSQKLDSRLRQLHTNNLWEHVLTYAKAHEILNVGSTKFKHFEDTAQREMTKPVVSITGFYTDGTTNQTAAFLEFYLPIEKTTYSHQVRVGEEFYGLRLAAIIGNNQGVTMESLETDQTFDILMSSTRR